MEREGGQLLLNEQQVRGWMDFRGKWNRGVLGQPKVLPHNTSNLITTSRNTFYREASSTTTKYRTEKPRWPGPCLNHAAPDSYGKGVEGKRNV